MKPSFFSPSRYDPSLIKVISPFLIEESELTISYENVHINSRRYIRIYARVRMKYYYKIEYYPLNLYKSRRNGVKL
jgi:hypothetical protein